MTIRTVAVTAFAGQRPGTSGLRKKVSVFRQPGYLEAFIQSLLDALPEAVGHSAAGKTLVLGGDGRFFNDVAIRTIVAIAAANGVSRLLVGRDGLLSTPAASAVIRKHGCFGGIILSASHNPAGADGDFGIKFNTANGGPAPERVTEAIWRHSRSIASYRTIDSPPPPFDQIGATRFAGMEVAVIDPVADYLELMQRIFDFDRLRELFARGFRLRFDAMSAVTGPYAREIFERQLGAPAGTAVNAEPKPDFAGRHPDPNPVHAAELIAALTAADGPDIGAASDGDGDRNLIVGRNLSSGRATAWRCSPPMPGLYLGSRVASAASPGRCRRAGRSTASPSRSASLAGRPRPAGSISVPCSTPAGSRCAARRAPAPAPITSARKTGCGPSCFGSASSPSAG